MTELDEALEIAMRWKDEKSSWGPNKALGILSRALLESRVEIVNAATKAATPSGMAMLMDRGGTREDVPGNRLGTPLVTNGRKWWCPTCGRESASEPQSHAGEK